MTPSSRAASHFGLRKICSEGTECHLACYEREQRSPPVLGGQLSVGLHPCARHFRVLSLIPHSCPIRGRFCYLVFQRRKLRLWEIPCIVNKEEN